MDLCNLVCFLWYLFFFFSLVSWYLKQMVNIQLLQLQSLCNLVKKRILNWEFDIL